MPQPILGLGSHAAGWGVRTSLFSTRGCCFSHSQTLWQGSEVTSQVGMTPTVVTAAGVQGCRAHTRGDAITGQKELTHLQCG